MPARSLSGYHTPWYLPTGIAQDPYSGIEENIAVYEENIAIYECFGSA
jgi:hypothetical protein